MLVEWKRVGKSYWMRYLHLELIPPPDIMPDHSLISPRCGLAVGDRVRVKSSITTPLYKWGCVSHESVGIVRGNV